MMRNGMALGLLVAMSLGCGSAGVPLAAPPAPGPGPFLAADPVSFTFGDVPVGTTTSRNVTLSNTGTAEALITDVTVTGSGFSATGLSMPLALAPGASRTLTVGFTPPGLGNFSADVILASNASDMVVIAPMGSGVSPGGSPPPSSSGTPWFAVFNELYGDAGATAQQRMSQGLLDGVTFHPSITTSEDQFLTSSTPAPPFIYYAIPPETNVSSCTSSIDGNAGSVASSYTQRLGSKVWRLGMPEFDQGGGCWASGRPSLAGLTDPQAYAAWTNYYLSTKQLGPYLAQTAAQRGYKWMSVSSFAFSVQYALDMGVDAVLLERNEDEMSGITPGLAMIRGAAAQHGGRDWGIDISTWRYWNNGPTVYSSGVLVTGWSPSTFKRNLFISYMGGANIIHMEGADYTTGAASGSSLNPLGQTVQAFHDFAVKRHPNRGTPYVPMALVQEHQSGFEPKFGEWMQGSSKWYWSSPYSQGDQMLANLLDLAYPGHATWGKLGSGAPKILAAGGSIDVAATQAAYRQALAQGADPRPWEPMGNSQWGEIFDVITDRAPLSALQRYKVVALATGTPMSDALLGTLTQYVQQGGTLVLNARQLTAAAEALTGLHLTAERATATAATWVPDGSISSESLYNYTVATPTSATVVAQTSGNPIVTRNLVGGGSVYVTTPDSMADATGAKVLNVGAKLLGMLQGQLALVQVQGPQLEYLVSTDGGRIIVTLVNTDLSGATWSGTLSFKAPASSYSVKEWTADATVASTTQAGKVVVSATVPAFDVRVYVLDAV